MRNKKFKKAFTLVELLVAIAIIGILSVLGYALYSVAKRAARNTARESAVTEISGFMEEYETRFRKKPSSITLQAAANTVTFAGTLPSERVVYDLTPLSGITSYSVIATCTCSTVSKTQLVITYIPASADLAVCLEPNGQKIISGCTPTQ